MRHLFTFVLVASFALVCGACGEDLPAAPRADDMQMPDFPDPSELGDAAAAAKDYWKTAGEIELTDEMMEEFFSIAEEAKAAGDDKAKQIALITKRGWDWARWGAVAAQLSMAESLVEGAPEIEAELGRIEKKIEETRAEIAEASAEKKPMLEARLAQMEQIYEMQQKQLRPMMDAASKVTDKNRAILAKYRERWKKLDEGR